jgi:cell division septation protein DedD
VDLWRAGDWAGAVANWQPFAAAGDADAMFNMGQAYKLGRAVPLDKAIARDWYRKAAAKGHLPAQANLGILLFQAGEKTEAAQWLKSAADRGEMRAQYVLGVAHWNGDGVPRSLPLAYAYLARSSAQGLGEATGALNNLTRTISPVERANGWAIATSLAAGNGIPPAYVPASKPMTAAELNRATLEAVQRPQPSASVPPPPPVQRPAPAAAVAAPSSRVETARTPVASPAVPPPKPAGAQATTVAASPAPAVTPAAVPAAVETPVAERPAAPEVRTVELPAAKPVAVAEAVQPPATKAAPDTAADKPKPAAKKPEPAPPGWRVQLGAFGKQAQAEAAWTDIKTKQKAAVGTAKPIYEPGTSIIKLQMGPYKTRDAAKDACAKLAFAGRACFVTEAAKGK